MFKLLFLATAVSLFLVGAAVGQSGGLYLPENGGPINGTAQAGSAAVARDAETAWLNPAGMTRLDSPQFMLGLMPSYLDADFNPNSATTPSGGDGGQQGKWIPAGAAFFATPVDEQVALGFSLTSLGGFALNPDNNWVARTWMSKIRLVGLNLEPSIGVRVSEQVSLGAGLDVQYVKFEQKLLGPLQGNQLEIDGDSWDVGVSLSALWELSEATRFGLRWRSEVNHDLDGDLEVQTGRGVSTSFTWPQSITFSPYHEINERLALMADVGWTDWSAFDRNVISFDNTGAEIELPRDFKDVWTVALGAHVRPAEDWLLTFGGSYTSSAVDDEDRTPDLPVDEQVRLAAGVEYQINQQWDVGANYVLAWLGDNEIDQTHFIARRVVGDYDAYMHMFTLYGSVSF